MPSNIEKLKKNLETARQAHEKTHRALNLAWNLYKTAVTEEREKEPWGLFEALEVYFEGIENDRGYLMLETVIGPDHQRGYFFAGSYWPTTNQRVLTVRLEKNWSDEKLRDVASGIESMMWAIKPGAYDDGSAIGARFKNCKAFSLVTHRTKSNYSLVQLADGSWSVYEMRFGRGIPEASADLVTVLRLVRDALSDHDRCDGEDE